MTVWATAATALFVSLMGGLSSRTPSALAFQTAETIQSRGINPPPVSTIYTLTADNRIYALRSGDNQFRLVGAVRGVNGNLIGFDVRPAAPGAIQRAPGEPSVGTPIVYGLSDTGGLYQITLNQGNVTAQQISTLNPNFAGGAQSLFDFNPVIDAIRIIGSNNQNYAVVKGANGVLNTTAVQTSTAYAAGDVNQGKTPSLSGGSYDNNLSNAKNTLFYAIDSALDTFVTIAKPLSATGSSNTGGGQLQTIGPLVTPQGQRINVNSTADIDCLTDQNGRNDYQKCFGISGTTFFEIDLNQINLNLPLGQTQPVVVKSVTLQAQGATNFIDIAVPVFRPAGT